ncbi:MAG: phage tail protein [Oscillatoriophycideae cyanobacterium NC_groundwater_1537_Pr4_S-0.65um_50_18]|nr:phage tail protein [Candidatus Woesearchaeota archaeon]MBI4783997.1 phage tail protein [Oscillatoriophycideae cyanobacterium NC_groundwater_1537_Pr4_S-0.65um_50_18]
MPALVFPSQFKPVIGSSGEVKYRINRLKFADGYEHLSPAGLNTKQEKFSVTFPGLSYASKTTLIAFLDSLQGYKSFQFTKPGETTSQLYRCLEGYSYKSLGGFKWEVSAVFTLTFSPD